MKIAGVATLSALATLIVAGCGSTTTTVTSTTVPSGGAHAAKPPHQGPGPTTTSTPSGGTPPTGSVDCGGGVTAGPHTSCPFAQNTHTAYEQAGGSGDQTVSAFSPATGQTYSMTCSGAAPHVCRAATTPRSTSPSGYGEVRARSRLRNFLTSWRSQSV
jgi:hypothetical protein